jgi:hypothetical protein
VLSRAVARQLPKLHDHLVTVNRMNFYFFSIRDVTNGPGGQQALHYDRFRKRIRLQ